MKNDLGKIRKLNGNPDLASRVGVAMFMHARSIDVSTASDNDKAFIQWIMGNPMAADQTMLALVASDADVIANATVVEVTTPQNNASNRAAGVVPPSGPPASEVNLDDVDDAVIEQAVTSNWETVANKYGGFSQPLVPSYIPSPVPESASVSQGQPNNPFLEDERPATYTKPVTRSDGQPL